MSTTPAPRAANAAAVGGALWVLLPVAWSTVSLQETAFGSLSFVAVAVVYWLFAVLPPALLLIGLSALRRDLGDGAGRLGVAGLAGAALGYAAMAVGNGIEVASMSLGGGEVAAGHTTFLIGFLISVLAGILLGIVVFRRSRPRPSRVAATLLVLALPLGIGIGLLGAQIAPGNDSAFWAAIAVPTGLAWVILGRVLAGTRAARAPEPARI